MNGICCRLTCTAALLLVLVLGAPAQAQEGDAVTKANNPLTPEITINFQDYFRPSLNGATDRSANQFLFRGLLPWKLGEAPQLFRFTLPLAI